MTEMVVTAQRKTKCRISRSYRLIGSVPMPARNYLPTRASPVKRKNPQTDRGQESKISRQVSHARAFRRIAGAGKRGQKEKKHEAKGQECLPRARRQAAPDRPRRTRGATH